MLRSRAGFSVGARALLNKLLLPGWFGSCAGGYGRVRFSTGSTVSVEILRFLMRFSIKSAVFMELSAVAMLLVNVCRRKFTGKQFVSVLLGAFVSSGEYRAAEVHWKDIRGSISVTFVTSVVTSVSENRQKLSQRCVRDGRAGVGAAAGEVIAYRMVPAAH